MRNSFIRLHFGRSLDHHAIGCGGSGNGERELVVLNWGFVLLQNDRAPKRVTNMRGRQGADEVLATVVRAAQVPGAGVVLLRAEGGEAGDLALVRGQRRGAAAALCLSGRMDALPRADQKG